MFKLNILFTSFVFGPSSGQRELGEARKTLLICQAWRGLEKNYLLVRRLEKLRQRILVDHKISTKTWGLDVGKWFGRTSIKIFCVIFLSLILLFSFIT